MVKKSSHRKGSLSDASSVSKGRIVERIVAQMHYHPDLKVDRNVRLLTADGRRREIDVLLTVEILGLKNRWAIECKNEAAAIGSPKIDAFCGKLDDVGIPQQNGIYVSASGYTSGATNRAKKVGIKTLTLKNLVRDDIANKILDTVQSVIYLLAEVLLLYIDTLEGTRTVQWLDFFDREGNLRGSIFDLIWQKWHEEEPSSILETHEVKLAAPPDWFHMVDGKIVPIISMTAVINVVGVVLTFKGQAEGHMLVNTSESTLEKSLISVSLDASIPSSSRVVSSEPQLQAHLNRSEPLQFVSDRVRLPRILVGGLYWPLSERTARIVQERMRAFKAGEIPDPRPYKFQEIESFATAFEIINKDHPFAKK